MSGWLEHTKNLIQDFCTKKGTLTFTLDEFYSFYQHELESFSPKNKNVRAKIRQQLQFLREQDFLFFVDNKGSYTVNLNKAPLPYQLDDSVPQELYVPPPRNLTLEEKHRREYTVEIFLRKRSWVKEAKKTYGEMCLLDNCKNTFVKHNGERYIETHHVVPLHLGGEDCLSNLSVVCAHHHRMAHFATLDEMNKIERHLLATVSEILKAHGKSG